MATFAQIKETATKIVKFGLTLPSGVQLITSNGAPLFPIAGDGNIVEYWLVFLQKQGNGARPPLAQVAGTEEPIVDLGHGWKVARLEIPNEEIHFKYKVIHQLQELAEKLSERDPQTEN